MQNQRARHGAAHVPREASSGVAGKMAEQTRDAALVLPEAKVYEKAEAGEGTEA